MKYLSLCQIAKSPVISKTVRNGACDEYIKCFSIKNEIRLKDEQLTAVTLFCRRIGG